MGQARDLRFQRVVIPAVSLLLLAVTAAIYLQVRTFAFVNYDDPEFVTANPRVRSGLSWENFRWAVTTTRTGNWIPVTWISHMSDVECFGVQASAHHLVNLGFHLLNVLLLLSALRALTGSPWRSAAVAALFALHPLHVEPVAWISQRRELLSTFFFLLSLVCYLVHVRDRSRSSFFLLIAAYTLGLGAKPMLVTLPFLLLLLDVWPLGRLRGTAPSPGTDVLSLVREKTPLFLLAIVAGLLTLYAQRRTGAVVSLGHLPVTQRALNAGLSVVVYLRKAIWPTDLAVFYPHPAGAIPFGQALLAAAGIVCCSVASLVLRRRHPAVAVGWGWFLVSLLPVLGLIQVGSQALADRYTYLPLTGLFVALVWAVPGLRGHRGSLPAAWTALFLLACAALGAQSFRQIGTWRDSRTLFSRAIAVTGDNALAQNNLAAALTELGDLRGALAHYEEALRINPQLAKSHSGIGGLLVRVGRADEALAHLLLACELDPNDPESRLNLANVLAARGDRAEALRQYRTAVGLAPESPETHYNLGTFLAANGRYSEAATTLREALRWNPDDADAHRNLGYALSRLGLPDEAAFHHREAERLKPGRPAL